MLFCLPQTPHLSLFLHSVYLSGFVRSTTRMRLGGVKQKPTVLYRTD